MFGDLKQKYFLKIISIKLLIVVMIFSQSHAGKLHFGILSVVKDKIDRLEEKKQAELYAANKWSLEGKAINEPYLFDVCVVQLDNGTYRLYGELHSANPVIRTYTSIDGTSWTLENSNIISGSGPCVVRIASNQWRIYYNGGAAGISSATSNDGVAFGASASVFQPDGSAYEQRVSFARVLKINDGLYRMYYDATDSSEVTRILSAYSADGVNWTRDSGVRIDPSYFGDPQSVRVAHACPVNDNGLIKLFFAGGYPEKDISFSGIYMAVSSDGINFNICSSPEIISTIENGTILISQDPWVISIAGIWRMYYGIYAGADVVEQSAIYSATKNDLFP